MKILNNLLSLFKNTILKITLKDVVYLLIIMLFIGLLSTAVSRCSDIKRQYKNNVAAMNDSIRYLKAKNGDLVATKLAFETGIKDLKMLNEELYDEIQNIKMKGDVTSGTHFEGVIEYEVHDTAYVVLHDTIDNGFSHDFAFNNEYRTLEGNVNYQNDTVGVNILKDETKFDYTVAMDDKNNIYITSSNPYVKYNQITGFQVPKQRQKRWYVGPSVGIGYDPLHNTVSPTIGVSFGFGLLRF